MATPKKNPNKALTTKALKFCAEYIVDYNATQAAVRAGYSEKTAGKKGWELLQDTRIMDQINLKLAEQTKRVNVNQDWVLYNCQLLFHRCMQIELTPDGKQYKFNASGAAKALEMIGRHFQMFTDNIHIDDLDTLLGLSDQERLNAISEILNTARTRAVGAIAEGPRAGQPESGRTTKH